MVSFILQLIHLEGNRCGYQGNRVVDSRDLEAKTDCLVAPFWEINQRSSYV